MTNFFQRPLRKSRQLGQLILICLLLVSFASVEAQPCPNLAGGTSTFRFSEPFNETHFPSNLPAGKTGRARSTAGRMIIEETMTTTYPLRTITINPEFTDGTMGSTVLRFDILGMASSSGVIRIYSGTTATGVPQEVINSTTASSYLLQTRVFNGPVTLTFESPLASASGDYDIRITYTTGDHVVTSPFGFQVAYWSYFITPNSYTALENYPESSVPIATAHFDGTKQLVSSEISFCIDYGASAPSIGNAHYPGQFVFYPTLRPDLDKSGTIDDGDALAAARLVYVLSHLPAPITDPDNFGYVQLVVDALTRRDNVNYGGLHGDALAAVPATPSPVEPQFSITGPASGTTPGVAQNFVVDLTDDGGHPRILTLQVPAGIIINSVTGATYDGVNNTLTFPASSSSATVSLTSPVDAVANIRVVYDQPDLWNINNLIVYEPCDTYAGYQGFLGVSTGTTPRPYREATGTWDTSMPVKLVDFLASAESNTVRLSWVTVAEENAKGFQVQRSKDAKAWHNLGFVAGKSENGNSTRELSYRFTDATPLKGNNYYRLQMVDLDGTFAYSQMRAIRVDGAASALLTYPNPVVNGNLNVDVANTDSYRAEIHNLTGIKVLHQNLGKGRELNVSSLPTGIYVLRLISADGDVRTGKFLVK